MRGDPLARPVLSMRRALPWLLVLAGSVALLSSVASAHGRVCLESDGTILDRGGHGVPGPTGATGDCPDGDLVEFVTGWQDEPPFTGVKNGLDLGIRVPSNNAPITNVTTLRAEYVFGGQRHEVGMSQHFGVPGRYGEEIAPTRPGRYQLHVWGNLTVGGTTYPIDFATNVADVQPMSDIEFPERADTPDASEQRIAALEQKVASLEARLNATGTRNGNVAVTPPPDGGRGAPGFEVLGLAAAVAVVAALRRRP